jgi:hypothetical protein
METTSLIRKANAQGSGTGAAAMGGKALTKTIALPR